MNNIREDIENKAREIYTPLVEMMDLLHQHGVLLSEQESFKIVTNYGCIYFGGGEIDKLKEKARKYDRLIEAIND